MRWNVWCTFRCWSGTGLDRRVLGMLVNLVDTCLDVSKLKIYLTGRTKGRALAAAFANPAAWPDKPHSVAIMGLALLCW